MMKERFPLKSLVSLSLSVCLLMGGMLPTLAQSTPSNVLTGDVRITVNPSNIRESLPIPGAQTKVRMSLHDVEVQDALRALAKKGGFNVLIDESVTGTISVDLNNVSIQDALETLKSYGNLAYAIQNKNLMVANADSEKGRAFRNARSRIFPLRNANAVVIANFLNSTVFSERVANASSSGGGTSGIVPRPVTADAHTNSIVVVGDASDIRAVEDHLAALDQPRLSKTWRLSQANALDVASLLSSSLFNEGRPPIQMTSGGSGGGGASAGGGAGGANQLQMPSSLRVTAENISEGSGTSQSSQSGGSSGGSSEQGSLVENMTLRTRIQEAQTIQISPTGPIILPDTRLNTLTLLGTAEQIAMAEAMIPTLDRKVPQVVLEATLLEISEDGRKELGFSSGGESGLFSFGSNNSNSATLINTPFSNRIGRTTSSATPLESIIRFNSRSLIGRKDFVYQLNALVSKNKAKVLANPTVVTTSDNETLISIVDEVIRSVTVTQGSFGGTPSFTTNLGEAGIIINILPRVGANNTVSMRVRPVISSVARTEEDRFGNVVTLLSKREALAQNVQLADGETFMLAGLIHDTNTEAIARNPLLSSLPIVGALGRNSTNSKHRSELVIMITPHIVNDDVTAANTPMHKPGSSIMPATLSSGKSQNGMVPVSFSDTSMNRSSALPPLEEVNVIDGRAYSSDPLERKSLVAPKPIPSGSLLPSDYLPSSSSRKTAPLNTSRAESPAKPRVTTPTSSTRIAPTPEPDTSDSAIQAIMDKFK